MKTTFEIGKNSKSFIINLKQDEEFSLKSIDINVLQFIIFELKFNENGLNKIRKALETYKSMELETDSNYHFPYLKFTSTKRLEYKLEIIFEIDHCDFYFDIVNREGTLILKKEDAKYLQKKLSGSPENKQIEKEKI